ncbi:MAG: hypothetical protein KIT22_14160, partial [Verrucomicrobiae bacterium]|nr:hypothetical protein [Verrucomicrobiae bacterium]
ERRKEIAEILRPGLLKLADAVDTAAFGLLEAEATTSEHFGLAFTPSVIVRALATAGRRVRAAAAYEATGRDLAEMTFGVVEK